MDSRSQKRRFNLLTIKKKRLAPIVWALTQQTNLTMEPFADRIYPDCYHISLPSGIGIIRKLSL